ncbi:rhodanese-like domain-containing protein [Lutibacter sp. B2]|nr:rhodanese-like domain-containing protein [Lutibacter sp. B2]
MISILILIACQSKQDKKIETERTYQKITPEQAKERLEKEEGIILLDVRTEEEYKEKHIPNSILIPLQDLDKMVEEKISDKDTTIFVYCRSGRRSQSAAEKLIEMGYENVFDLGGIIDWPYETE